MNNKTTIITSNKNITKFLIRKTNYIIPIISIDKWLNSFFFFNKNDKYLLDNNNINIAWKKIFSLQNSKENIDEIINTWKIINLYQININIYKNSYYYSTRHTFYKYYIKYNNYLKDNNFLDQYLFWNFFCKNIKNYIHFISKTLILKGFYNIPPLFQSIFSLLKKNNINILYDYNIKKKKIINISYCKNKKNEIFSSAVWAKNMLEKNNKKFYACVLDNIQEKKYDIKKIFNKTLGKYKNFYSIIEELLFKDFFFIKHILLIIKLFAFEELYIKEWIIILQSPYLWNTKKKGIYLFDYKISLYILKKYKHEDRISIVYMIEKIKEINNNKILLDLINIKTFILQTREKINKITVKSWKNIINKLFIIVNVQYNIKEYFIYTLLLKIKKFLKLFTQIILFKNIKKSFKYFYEYFLFFIRNKKILLGDKNSIIYILDNNNFYNTIFSSIWIKYKEYTINNIFLNKEIILLINKENTLYNITKYLDITHIYINNIKSYEKLKKFFYLKKEKFYLLKTDNIKDNKYVIYYEKYIDNSIFKIKNIIFNTNTINQYYNCAFRAFMLCILNIKEEYEHHYENNITKIKGIFIHKALYIFWKIIKNNKVLKNLSDQKIINILHYIVFNELNYFFHTLTPYSFINKIEQLFIFDILIQNIIKEKSFDDFTIFALEKSIKGKIGNINFSVRIDRIDISNNHKRIIDYKKSSEKIHTIINNQNINFQYFIYILLSNINTLYIRSYEKNTYFGISNIIDNLHTTFYTQEKWKKILLEYRKKILEISQNFINGYFPAFPNNQYICKNCNFHNICRIKQKNYE